MSREPKYKLTASERAQVIARVERGMVGGHKPGKSLIDWSIRDEELRRDAYAAMSLEKLHARYAYYQGEVTSLKKEPIEQVSNSLVLCESMLEETAEELERRGEAVAV